jgi:hypothetical protein
MLPKIFEKKNTSYQHGEVFDDYLRKIGHYADIIDKAFLSQICLEHFELFNNNFPLFDIDSHSIVRIKISAFEIHKNLRYENNEKIDFFYHMINSCMNGSTSTHPELHYCLKNLKWSFPPIIIRQLFGEDIGGRKLGQPYHLIEGCHRVSYINRLYETR